MNILTKQWLTPNRPVVQLSEHKSENLRKTWCEFESMGFWKHVLIFKK